MTFRKKRISMTAVLLAPILWGGCASQTPPKPQEVISAMNQAVEGVREKVGPSVVYVELNITVTGRGGQEVPRQVGATGIVLNEGGTILFPFNVEKDQIDQLKVWVGDEEHEGEYLQGDERAGISLIRIDPRIPLTPAQLTPVDDPAPGEWLVAVSATNDNGNYEKFIDLGVLRGVLPSEFDRFDTGALAQSIFSGTPITNMKGEIVGIAQNRQVLALRDIRGRLDRLLRKESEGEEGDSEEESGKPWVGMTFAPINEAYAEASGLPKEAVWVQNVMPESPAQKAGLREFDLITAVDGQTLTYDGGKALNQLFKFLSPEMGREVTLGVIREGKPVEVTVEFAKSPEPKEFKAEDLGIQVRELTEDLRYSQPIYAEKGVYVTGLEPGSPAAASGTLGRPLVRGGDVIVELDGSPTPTLEAFKKAWEGMRAKRSDVVLVKMVRGHMTQHAALNMKLGNSKGGE